MNEPPIPPPPMDSGGSNWEQPPGMACPHCGWLLPQQKLAFCPRCGKSLMPKTSSGWHVLWVVLFVMIGIPSLCLGGCLAVIAENSALRGSEQIIRPPILGLGLGAVGVIIFAGLLYLALRSKK